MNARTPKETNRRISKAWLKNLSDQNSQRDNFSERRKRMNWQIQIEGTKFCDEKLKNIISSGTL